MKKAISIIIVVLFIVSLFCNIFQYNSNKELSILIQENDSKTGLLENSLAEKETALEEANTNITELEATVSELQSQIEEINNQLAETEKQHEAELESIKKDTEVKEETKVVEQQPAAPATPSTPAAPTTPAFPDMSGLGGVISTTRPGTDLGECGTVTGSGDFAGVEIY